ncbi:MAG: THxN family PEP-CTERM protein [Halioglobus sp.]|nr:THxN family PEP-CTERM protein [Halioglobus sp.]
MNNSKSPFTRQLCGLAAGIGLLGAAGGAQADLIDGLVDIWDVEVAAEFLCGTAVFSPGSAGTDCASQAMSWGDSDLSDRSGLTISNLPAAQVTTNGPLVANTSVTHNNQPISGNSLDSVSLRSTLTLTPFSPGGSGLPSSSIDFLIDFLETPNGDEPCANGEPNDQGVNIDGCGDIFVLDRDGARTFRSSTISTVRARCLNASTSSASSS